MSASRLLPSSGIVAIILLVHVAPAFSADVRSCGAKGDGQTDDTTAIQKAVDSGGRVSFPKGVYRIIKPIVVELDKTGFTSLVADGVARVVMAGPGAAFRFVGTHAGSADPDQVKTNVWERQRMPMVDGLEIVGAHEEADGIEANGTMQITVTRTTVRNARHGIRLASRNRNVLIADCHLYHNRGIGVFYDDVNLHQSNISGCHISYCAGGGIVTRGGAVRNIHIGTCDIESNMSPEGEPTANVLIDCTGGSTGEVAITGCTLQHNSKSPGSANIRILGQGTTSAGNPNATQEGHIAITGNVLSDVMVNVHLRHVRGVTISGNTFWQGFEHDLLVENSRAVVVGANDFDRNPRYVVNGNWGKDRGGLTLRDCSDCLLNGFVVSGVWSKEAAVSLERCDRCTLAAVSVLDCDGVGVQMRDCARCQVMGCLVRDDRPGGDKKATHSIHVANGEHNWIHGNLFADGVEVTPNAATLEGNRP
jgi:hypothetical protein